VDINSIKLTVLYDNTRASSNLLPGWGFSILVEASGRKILVDTGADIMILEHNMEKLKIKPKEIDMLFLTHRHCDHIGALSAILSNKKKGLRVCIPDSFCHDIKERIEVSKAEIVIVRREEELLKNVYTTGELAGEYLGIKIAEQSMLLNTNEGIVVIAGCAHSKIENIVKKAKELFGNRILLAVGGFHLSNKKKREVEETITFLDPLVDKIAPTHCTGKKAMELFSSCFKDRFISCGVGKVISPAEIGLLTG